jgi:hypothetical protein
VARPIRKAQRTLLIVGEGHDEAAFLVHVKSLFITRGCGLSVTIKNAQGKGAKHVVEYTIGQKKNAAYDHVAALLDTDTDWTDTVRARAENNDIVVLKSEPCLEAVLLRVMGKKDQGNSNKLKKQLRAALAGDASEKESYATRFTKAVLEKVREPSIEALINLLTSHLANGNKSK